MSGYMVMIAKVAIDFGHSELSGDTLAALQEFYNDRDSQDKRFQRLKLAADSNSQQVLSMDMFTEDWNASQFWVRKSDDFNDFSMLGHLLERALNLPVQR